MTETPQDSDTPRTNEQWKRHREATFGIAIGAAWDFARQLERELREKESMVSEFAILKVEAEQERDQLRTELAEVREQDLPNWLVDLNERRPTFRTRDRVRVRNGIKDCFLSPAGTEGVLLEVWVERGEPIALVLFEDDRGSRWTDVYRIEGVQS